MKGKNEPTIHQKNLQAFMTEAYETVNGVAPPVMNSLFNFRANIYNIRNFQEIFTENRKTYQAPLLWANLQSEDKNAKSLEEFKSRIKTWKCRLRKNYMQNLGFFYKINSC